jgi:hypothetical protein
MGRTQKTAELGPTLSRRNVHFQKTLRPSDSEPVSYFPDMTLVCCFESGTVERDAAVDSRADQTRIYYVGRVSDWRFREELLARSKPLFLFS